MKNLTLHLDLQTKCNLKCQQCQIWKNRTTEPLEIPSVLAGLRDFRSYCDSNNRRGYVSLSGGEVFLDPSRLFTALQACQSLGLPTTITTNGVLVTKDLAKWCHRLQVRNVNISLDGLQETHDRLRGQPGAFESAVAGILCFVNQNKIAPTTKTVIAMTLMRSNYLELGAVAALARDLQAQHFSLQLLSPDFSSLTGVPDKQASRNYFMTDVDKAQAKEAVLKLYSLALPSRFFLQGNTSNYRMLVNAIDDVEQAVCASADDSVMIDPYGNVSLCLFMSKYITQEPLGNIGERSLLDILGSEHTKTTRALMRSCSRPCGMLNCHRKQI